MIHKVRPNEPQRLSARAWNKLADNANARHSSSPPATSPDAADAVDVLIRNDSGSDKDRFSVLGITGLVFSPTDAAETWQECLKGSTAVGPGHTGKYVVCQEPIASGAIGRARLIGTTRVKVWMADPAAPPPSWAEVVEDMSSFPGLRGTSFGSARVLYCEPTGQTRWALVRLGNFGSRPERLYTYQQGGGPGISGFTFLFNEGFGDDVGLTLAPTLDYFTPTVFGRATIHFGAQLILNPRTDNPLSVPRNQVAIQISPDGGASWLGVPQSSTEFGAILDRQTAPQALPYGDLVTLYNQVNGIAILSLSPGYRMRMIHSLVSGNGGAYEGWLHVTR